jgi:hypothetical protein
VGLCCHPRTDEYVDIRVESRPEARPRMVAMSLLPRLGLKALIALPIALAVGLAPPPADARPAGPLRPLLNRPVSPWWLMAPAAGLMVWGLGAQATLARSAFSASTRSSKGTLLVPRI